VLVGKLVITTNVLVESNLYVMDDDSELETMRIHPLIRIHQYEYEDGINRDSKLKTAMIH
jgi:hypothetical protein